MRLLFGLFLFASLAHANDDFETRLSDLEKKHADEEFQLRPKTKFDGRYPNEEYSTEFGHLKDKHLREVLSLYEEECKKSKNHCLTEEDIKLRSVQSRIAIGLVKKKNEWAKEGLSQEEIKKKEEEYSKESSEILCKEGGKCDTPVVARDVSSSDTPVVETPPVETPKVETPKEEKPVKESVNVVEENDDEKSPRNYDASSCKWVSDLPRKVVNGPGCSKTNRSRICTGYVVCDQKVGGGKFIRMSTCRPEFCGGGDENAVKCTKDMRYFSQKPSREDKLFMSSKLKKILGGASEQ